MIIKVDHKISNNKSGDPLRIPARNSGLVWIKVPRLRWVRRWLATVWQLAVWPRSGVSGVGTRGPVDTGTPATEATWSIGHSDQGPGV